MSAARSLRGVSPMRSDDADVWHRSPRRQRSCRLDNVRSMGVDATVEIPRPEVTRAVSTSRRSQVRADCGAAADWSASAVGVVEGRDIGPSCFPSVTQVYLTARPDVRAARRAKEVRDLAYARWPPISPRDALDQGVRTTRSWSL